jgi:PKD repeat protein
VTVTNGGPFDEIVDNDSTDFTTVGTWTASTLVSGYYGSNYLWTSGGTGESTAEWRFQIPEDGYYQALAWWSAPYSTRSAAVPYTVFHASGSTTVMMDQTTDGSQWNDLGVYYFTAGTGRIVLTNEASDAPVADAIRVVEVAMPIADFEASETNGEVGSEITFTNLSLGAVDTFRWDFGDGELSTEENPVHSYQEAGIYTVTLEVSGADGSDSEQKADYIVVTESAPFEQIIDNGAAGFSSTGIWYSSTYVPGYYGSNYTWTYGSAGTSTAEAEWTFDLPSAGTYQVFGWWSAPYSTRSPDTPYTVYHASGSTTVEMNQNTNGSQWNSLGVYYFPGGPAIVRLSNQASGNPVADAVRIVRVSD